MKLEKVKKTKTKVPSGRNLFKKTVAVLLSIGVFCGSYYFINKASAEARDTVEVVRVKAKEAIPKDTAIAEDDVEKYQIIRKEYNEDMVLFADLEYVLEKYTTDKLRKGAILHYDEVSTEKPQKDPWIYISNDESLRDKEILTIPFNHLESGGSILTPGDRVRIRVTYEAEETETMEETDIWGETVYTKKQIIVERNEDLFESIVVTDMLNSKNRSIYAVYQEVLRYPESERQKLLKSDDFMNSIVPKALVLAATSAQVEHYMKYKSRSKAILITILPRDEYTTILDQGAAFGAEVQVWLDKQK